MLLESLKYYLLDVELLKKYNRDFEVKQFKEKYKIYGSNLGEKYLQERIEKIKNKPTYGADNTFKRLIIIYEKQGQYEEALKICDKAIAFGENTIFYNKKSAAIKKKMGLLE